MFPPVNAPQIVLMASALSSIWAFLISRVERKNQPELQAVGWIDLFARMLITLMGFST